MEETTKLSGGQSSYSSQFKQIVAIRRHFKVEVTDLGDSPLRVFVGSTLGQRLPFEVLKYSIETRSSRSVTVTRLDQALEDAGIDLGKLLGVEKGGTPFSFQRYLIPSICDHKGTAIYLDSDMLVFDDIKDLFDRTPVLGCANAALTNKNWSREEQLSVLVILCDRAPWNLNSLIEATKSQPYVRLRASGPTPDLMERTIPSSWNSLENFKKGQTQLVHFTDMSRQPWLSCSNQLAYLWVNELRNAVLDGVISREDLSKEIAAGHIRPGLSYQVENDFPDPLSMPAKTLARDELFLQPHLLHGRPELARLAEIGSVRPSKTALLARRVLGRLSKVARNPLVAVPVKATLRVIKKIFRAAATIAVSKREDT